jgi:hypothetical protein
MNSVLTSNGQLHGESRAVYNKGLPKCGVLCNFKLYHLFLTFVGKDTIVHLILSLRGTPQTFSASCQMIKVPRQSLLQSGCWCGFPFMNNVILREN